MQVKNIFFTKDDIFLGTKRQKFHFTVMRFKRGHFFDRLPSAEQPLKMERATAHA